MKKKKIYFDIINSVKGGSGKSTVSLLLAACLKSIGVNAYVIDLDLHGSSWYSNFCKGSTNTADAVWVNSWMEDAAYQRRRTPFVLVDVEIGTTTDKTKYQIPTAIVNTEKPIVVDEVETDLFERAILQIINRIIAEESTEGVDVPVHIVMDMPPSNEAHAERILNHLLLDAESPLVQEFSNSKGSYDCFEPYTIQLIMLSSISGAHLKLNKQYIERFAKAKSFSSLLDELVRSNRLHLLFWGNDVVGAVNPDTDTSTAMLDGMRSAQEAGLRALTPGDVYFEALVQYAPIIIEHSTEIRHDIRSLTENNQEIEHISDIAVKNIVASIQLWK